MHSINIIHSKRRKEEKEIPNDFQEMWHPIVQIIKTCFFKTHPPFSLLLLSIGGLGGLFKWQNLLLCNDHVKRVLVKTLKTKPLKDEEIKELDNQVRVAQVMVLFCKTSTISHFKLIYPFQMESYPTDSIFTGSVKAKCKK